MKKEKQIALGDLLVTYWQSLLTGDDMPTISEFVPNADLKPLLPHILILEVGESDITVSLLGPAADKKLPINPTGHSYLETMPSERRYPTMLRVQAMLQHKCGARLEIEEEISEGVFASTYMTVVPFAADGDRSACLVAIAPPDTMAEENGKTEGRPFLGRPMKHFDYLDIGFGGPSQIVEKIMGIEAASPDLAWPDLKTLFEQR